jgi:hypothetical protein
VCVGEGGGDLTNLELSQWKKIRQSCVTLCSQMNNQSEGQQCELSAMLHEIKREGG